MTIIILKLSLAEKLPTIPTPLTHPHTRKKSHFIGLATWEWMEERRKGTSGNMDKSLHFLNIIFQLWLKARDNITALYRWKIFHKHNSKLILSLKLSD